MSRVRFDISLSLDGYMAGPDQSVENPIGVGGMAVFEWMFPLASFQKVQGRDDPAVPLRGTRRRGERLARARSARERRAPFDDLSGLQFEQGPHDREHPA